MKLKLLPLVFLFSAMSISFAQMPALSKTTFDGSWKAQEKDGLIMSVSDDGANINADVYSGGFDHSIRGTHQGSLRANITIIRTNIQNRCTTRMFGTWSLISDDTMRAEIKGTDGRCDLPTNFTEYRTWVRY